MNTAQLLRFGWKRLMNRLDDLFPRRPEGDDRCVRCRGDFHGRPKTYHQYGGEFVCPGSHLFVTDYGVDAASRDAGLVSEIAEYILTHIEVGPDGIKISAYTAATGIVEKYLKGNE